MNIEQAKAELAALEPTEAALWIAFRHHREVTDEASTQWSDAHRRLSELRAFIAVSEEQKP